MNPGGKSILIAGCLLFGLMLASLLAMSDVLQNSQRFGEYYTLLLVANTAGLIILLFLIVVNLRNLAVQLRRRVAGSRMTVRMVTMFSILAVTPVLVVYFFSLDFLHRGIDNWFDLRVERALDDSLELSRLALELRKKEILKQTQQIANGLSEITNAAVPFEIDDHRLRSGAEELTVMTRQGTFIASSASDTSSLVPERPHEGILFQVQQGDGYVGLDYVGNAGLVIRAVVNIPQLGIEPEPRIVQALFPFSARVNELAENVERAFIKYGELSYLREQLKFGFVLVLTLVLLFSVLSAVWAAFYSAARLAAPIRDLAQGTQSVAAGDYSTQLPVPGKDELGVLVASFNDMTRKIATATDAARHSAQEAEAQRSYLEAVLSRLSSGVLVLDRQKCLRTANISSGQILGVDVVSLSDRTLVQVQTQYPYLEPLLQGIGQHIDQGNHDWREQITLFGLSGRQILMCRGASLTPPGETDADAHVIVFDDVTALIQAQRNAAWSEMARRLAHEIKNPLTPIQLAAERLRHKYLHTLGQDQTDTLDRLTNTIVQQVETMKEIVNTFSDYARPPVARPEHVDLNKLVREVMDLYVNLDVNAEIRLELEPTLPKTTVDPGRIRQVLNNLLNNAFDASAAERRVKLLVKTSHVHDAAVDFIEIRIRDSGHGISEDIIASIFDPYVTTKLKGTGLGLAIVKKIIDEHNGLVWMENNRDGPGACAVIRLPVTADAAHESLDTMKSTRDAV
ncbi:MAG: HAMP domain-containing protein [Gammaproteobacteria bacterium]|nr:HAMP domain-containing protein [Gammaproteobacteria bacterium]